MRFLKWAGKIAIAGMSAGVLAVSGIGAAVASAHPGHSHDLINVSDVVVPVTVFAPVHIANVLNNLDVLSHNDIVDDVNVHDVDVEVLDN